MIGKKMVSKRALTLSEVKSILEAREKDGALGFEQQATKEYLSLFAPLPLSLAQELVNELQSVPHVTEDIAVMLVNVRPTYAEQVQHIAAKEKITLSSDEVEKILSILKKAQSWEESKTSS